MATHGTRVRTRSNARSMSTAFQTGVWKKKVGSQFVNFNPVSKEILSPALRATPTLQDQSTVDEVHDWPRVKEGGPFLSVRRAFPLTLLQGMGNYDTGTTLINGFVLQYSGGFLPQWPWTGDEFTVGNYLLSGLSPMFVPSVAAYEPEVYSKLRPRLSTANAAVFLAELRDLPGMLRTTCKGFSDLWKLILQADDFRHGASKERLRRLAKIPQMVPKKAADHFLNVSFGYIPFVNDMKQFCDTFVNEGERLYRLKRDNDKWIKRKWVHDEIDSITVLASGSGATPPVQPWGFTFERMCTPDGNGNLMSWSVEKHLKTLVWSEGSFKYYRPEFDMSLEDHKSSLTYVKQLCTLYGLRVNPSTIYKATPWTWAADWITNIGDHVDRVTDYGLDGIAAKYMYLMHRQVNELVLTVKINFTAGPLTLRWSRRIDTKQRKAAGSPYGFTNSWESLSGRQVAIAAALGITRLR